MVVTNFPPKGHSHMGMSKHGIKYQQHQEEFNTPELKTIKKQTSAFMEKKNNYRVY